MGTKRPYFSGHYDKRNRPIMISEKATHITNSVTTLREEAITPTPHVFKNVYTEIDVSNKREVLVYRIARVAEQPILKEREFAELREMLFRDAASDLQIGNLDAGFQKVRIAEAEAGFAPLFSIIDDDMLLESQRVGPNLFINVDGKLQAKAGLVERLQVAFAKEGLDWIEDKVEIFGETPTSLSDLAVAIGILERSEQEVPLLWMDMYLAGIPGHFSPDTGVLEPNIQKVLVGKRVKLVVQNQDSGETSTISGTHMGYGRITQDGVSGDYFAPGTLLADQRTKRSSIISLEVL